MIVKIKNNIFIIVLTLFFSCKNTNRLRIETNSLNPNFIGILIDSLPVKKGDTILFRNWKSFVDTISIYGSDNKKYFIITDSIVQFFKTVSKKYKTKKMTVLDKQSQSLVFLETNVTLAKDRQSYDPVRPPCYFSFIKKSDSIGQMEFEYFDISQFILDFKIKDNALYIVKMSDFMTYRGEEFNYNLDTLIVYNKINRLIKKRLTF